MNVIVPPRVPPDDEIDGLLRAFFRAELPHPWPAMKAPAPPTTPARPAPSRPALWRSGSIEGARPLDSVGTPVLESYRRH